MPGPRGSALTSTTREGLRTKLDGIVASMVQQGHPSADIQAVVNDFKARNFIDTPAEPSWGDLIWSGVGAAAKSAIMAPVNLARTAWDSKDPITFANRVLVQPSIEQGKKMVDAGRQGRYAEMLGHAGGMVPLLGPAAAAIGEKIGTGDPTQIAEGLGETAAMVGTGPALRAAAPLVGAVGRVTQAAGTGMWQRAAKIPENLTRATEAFRKTGELAAGDAQIAHTVLSRGRGGLTAGNTRALLQEQTDAGRAVSNLREGASRATMQADEMLGALDDEIAQMKLGERPQAEIDAAIARRQELADRWTDEHTSVATERAGDVTIDPETAARVRDTQVQGYREMVDRPTMRQAEARGVPGESRFPLERPNPATPTPPLSEVGETLRTILDDHLEDMRRAGASADELAFFEAQRNEWLAREQPPPTPTPGTPVPGVNPKLGSTFESVYPERPPASQAALNESHAVPDPIRMGGYAGEYAPVRSTTTTTTSLRPASARKVEAMRTAADSGSPIERTASRWQDRNIPGLTRAKSAYGALKPAADVMNKATKRVRQEAPLSMTQAVLAPTGLPAALAYLQRSGPLSHAGQWTFNGGKWIRAAGRKMPGIRYSAFPVEGAGYTAGAELDEQEATRQAMIQRLRGR